MSDYLITGKKGNGKSIFAVGVIIDALLAGKKVATNLDLHLHKRNPYWKLWAGQLTRLPDVIDISDLAAIGRGQAGVVEDDNGVILLDETSKILNSRDWQNKGRNDVLDWLVHSRKLGWDVYMIAQGVTQLDKMLRTSLLEYHVQVIRTDKWKIPMIGNLGKLIIGKPFTFPKLHIGVIRQGFHQGAVVVDRKYYRGIHYYDLYDTQQLFLERDHPQASGLYSVLDPWTTHGRHLPARPRSVWHRVQLATVSFVNCDFPRPALAPKPKPKHPLVERIMRLPPDRRAEFFRRFEQCGAFQ